ncbi:MAG TPA: lipoate--protein ligase family protein [Myxococcales bacterium]|nr:lipoate--protein ligase family protein [Myxococcales bacterium]HIK85055.1 lipoate--protein ligase family protein [Myxococcales bacterium]
MPNSTPTESDVDGRRHHSKEPLRLHRDQFPNRPILDTAISHAMLRRVAAGVVGNSLRLYLPSRALLFSSLDARRPGFVRALELAVEAGFPPVTRLAGGQAAMFLDESIAFAWATRDVDAHLRIRPRFEALAEWIARSLRRLGLDARVGEIPGEYCPGEFSVNLGGRVKVMGVGQRVIRGGAHIGGVLTVAQTGLLRQTLAEIYEVLGLEFHEQTAGGVADFDESLDCEQILAAMIEELSESGYVLEAQTFDESIIGEAEQLLPLHDPQAKSPSGGGLGTLLRASRHAGKTVVQEESEN